ncbi:MAG: translation initiation factor IF-5A [Candidatus Hodarchaeota archaeon]
MSVTRKDAKQLKKGNYLMIDGEVHRVIRDPQVSSPGKHGSAKIRVASENIFTGKKTSSTFPSSQTIEVPNIDKRVAQVTHVTDLVVGLMDNETYESFEVPIPEDEELAGKISSDVNVEYWVILDKKKINKVI